jgi:hypothetical protein
VATSGPHPVMTRSPHQQARVASAAPEVEPFCGLEVDHGTRTWSAGDTASGRASTAYASWLEAVTALQTYGTMMKSSSGYPMQSPYLSIASKDAEIMIRIAAELLRNSDLHQPAGCDFLDRPKATHRCSTKASMTGRGSCRHWVKRDTLENGREQIGHDRLDVRLNTGEQEQDFHPSAEAAGMGRSHDWVYEDP